ASSIPVANRLPAAFYTGLSMDPAGRLYAVSVRTGTTANSGQIWRETGAGSGAFATMNAAALSSPRDVAVDGGGNAYVTVSGSSQVLKINGATGAATVLAGVSTAPTGLEFFNYDGDFAPATAARLNLNLSDFNVKPTGTAINVPHTAGITLSNSGEIIFTDSKNRRIRRIR
ncbi:MAG: hypothetical protein ACKV2V_30465, partial [Blastocatellia bacterium]